MQKKKKKRTTAIGIGVQFPVVHFEKRTKVLVCTLLLLSSLSKVEKEFIYNFGILYDVLSLKMTIYNKVSTMADENVQHLGW